MDPQPVGRDSEIAEICAFLSATSGASASVAIIGDAGIGKTVVWKHVVQVAGRFSRVLSCQPAPAERPLAFSALDDLFGDVIEEVLPVLPVLPGPRRRAVEAALLRDASLPFTRTSLPETDRPLPERRVLARGVCLGPTDR